MSLGDLYYCVAIAGVVVLLRYTWDTNQIKKAAISQAKSTEALAGAAFEQIEAIFTPCVLLVAVFSESGTDRKQRYWLKNVGSGVALNVCLFSPKWEQHQSFQALPPNATASTELISDDFVYGPVLCTFESLNGTRYKSESWYETKEEPLSNLNLRHAFTKLT